MEGDAPFIPERRQTCFGNWVHNTFLLVLPPHLRWAYLWFGLCLILLIGSQGFIFPVRSSLFYDIIENHYCTEPRCNKASSHDAWAKAMLPLFQLPLVLIFNFSWGISKNPRFMILMVCSFFTALFVPIWIGLEMGGQWDLDHGMYTHNEDWLAYLTYYTVELKSVICPVMIWCVVNDLTPPKLAKIAYPPVVFAIQIGTVIGSFMAARVNWFGGNMGLVIIQVFCLVAAAASGLAGIHCFRSGPMPEIYLNQPAADVQVTPGAGQAREGFCRAILSSGEGIWLILTHPYLLCTAWVSVAHLVPRLFLDFQGTQVVKNYCAVQFPDDHHAASECKTSFFGWVNLVQSLGTMLIALVGTRKIVELGGLRLSLSVLPLFAIAGNLVTFLTIWSLGAKTVEGGLLPNLWITQIAIILMNTFGYGLNGPSREMLYVKTTRDMKYKAKSWSDMYGNSSMKSLASIINALFNSNGDPDAGLTSVIASAWVAVWLVIVQIVGKKHKSLMDSGEVVGEGGVGRWGAK